MAERRTNRNWTGHPGTAIVPWRVRMAVFWLLLAWALMGVAVSASAGEAAFEAPGTQPLDDDEDTDPPFHIEDLFVSALSSDQDGDLSPCSDCHSVGLEAGPMAPWQGSMMGNSARDPIFWAQLDLVNYDHNVRPQVLGTGDVCLRCHSPVGWLEGRSEDPDADAPDSGETDLRFAGMEFNQKDMHGVQCHFCHRLIDPLLVGENEIGDMANILDPLGTAGVRPPTYGNGMFVVDSRHLRRGPYSVSDLVLSGQHGGQHVPDDIVWEDATTDFGHPTAESPFHASGNICGTCHDVSNPTDLLDPDPSDGVDPTGADVQDAFPIERTWTEWRHSSFYDGTDPGGVAGGEAQNCQSCHMSGPLNSTTYGAVCFGNNEHLNDIHTHDMMGGNRIVPLMLKEMSRRWLDADEDHTAFRAALMDDDGTGPDEGLYPETTETRFLGIDAVSETDFSDWYTALEEASLRAERTLRRSAYVTVESDDGDSDGDGTDELVVRVTNRTGHKLPTGYPEGRRMWLNVVFRDAAGGHDGESGYYDSTHAELHHDQNLDGLAHDDGGAPAEAHDYDVIEYTDEAGDPIPGTGRPTKVWEGRAHFDAAADGFHDTDAEWDHREFHFALVNTLHWDNRIPPEGWIIDAYEENRALPDTDIDEADAADPYEANGWQSDYDVGDDDADADSVAGDGLGDHFDDITYPYPESGTDRVEITLYYQTTSKEYIEALRCDNPGAEEDCPASEASEYNRGKVAYELWSASITHAEDGTEIGKSAPFAIRSFVHAVADDDGDGLSDGWEAEHFEDDALYGYNDNPDGDALNNYQEFQAGTDPNDPNDPLDVPVRTPVNLVLVLDISGSMDDPAPGTSVAKMDILKESVELFLTTWSEYAVPQDRLAVVYFESDVTEFTPADAGGLAPLANDGPVSFVDYWEEALADVQSQSPLDYTAMGGGLYYALTGTYPPVDVPDTEGALVSTDLPKHVILFSNGMQNYSPMVTYGGTDDALQIENQDVSVAGVYGLSNLDPIPASEGVEGAFVHTIGIGVSGSNAGGDSWHELIADIADQTNGKHNFITQAYDMEGVFLEDLVEALKGNTLAYVFEDSLALSADPVTIEIPVNQSASKMSVVVSWAEEGDYPPQIELLRADGTPQDLSQITRSGSFFRIATRYLGDPDESPEDYGTWQLRLTSPNREHMQVRVHVLVDETGLQHTFNAPTHLRVGRALSVTMMAQQDGRILRWIDEASVTVDAPTKSVANALAASQHSMTSEQIAAADPDLTVSPYSQKLLAAYSDPTFVASLASEETTYDLLAAAPAVGGLASLGVFSQSLFAAQVPGHYKLHFKMVGHTRSGEHFERKETRSLFVEPDRADTHLSRVRHVYDNRDYVTLSPMDDSGNLLGPGNASQVAILTAAGHELTVLDDLDGSYRAELPDGFSSEDEVAIFVRGSRIFTDTLLSDDGRGLEIGGIDVTTGSEAGGDVITISGENFLPGVIVRLGGVEATEVIVISDSQIQVTVPAGTGEVSLEVENPGGETAQQSAAFTYQPVGVTPGTGLPTLVGFGLGGGPFSGQAEPGANVKIFKDGEVLANVYANSQGSFYMTPSTPIPVEDREYVFEVQSYDSNGNQIGRNTYILNTFVGRNVQRSSIGRDGSASALELLGGASQTFRFVVNPGTVEISLYAHLTGNVTPTFVVFGEDIPYAALSPDGGPDSNGWRNYTTTVTVAAGGGSTMLTLAVSTPLQTPVDAAVRIDDITIVEP